MYIYGWGLKENMNKWKQTVWYRWIFDWGVAMILLFEQVNILFFSQDSVHKRAERCQTKLFNTSLIQTETQNPVWKAILKVI